MTSRERDGADALSDRRIRTGVPARSIVSGSLPQHSGRRPAYTQKAAVIGSVLASTIGPITAAVTIQHLGSKPAVSAATPIQTIPQSKVLAEPHDRSTPSYRQIPPPEWPYDRRLSMVLPFSPSFEDQRGLASGDAAIGRTTYKEVWQIERPLTFEALGIDPRSVEVVGIFGSSPGGLCRWTVAVNGWQTGRFTTSPEQPATIRIKLGRPRIGRTLTIHNYPERAADGAPCLMAPPHQLKSG